ncbi:MAG TPA: cobalamin-independent methionine synthase II family protein [Micropepsaceae bacterium]|jgi:5-methyltetrahydropteroyltriglutamate--homocysteine methyltransferase|nr:cobalamin-independent methionine synthase II family protein [Micropepsaceae bacterium]
MGLSEERQRRILTTHVGSLPRPDALSELMADNSTGGPDYPKMVRDAVTAVVKRQTDCGIDIVDDGEQSKPGFITYIDERLAGMEPRTDNPPQIDTREKRAFPEFYAHGHSGTRPPPRLCTGPVRYTGQKQLQTDIANLKVALGGVDVTDVFMPAVSPGQIFRYHVNKYYKSSDEFLVAVGEAMREEYQAIIAAGFMLQIDDPHLAMHYMLEPNLSIEETRRWAEHYVEILNHALRDLPPDRIRHHTCYGINMGPRTHDIEFKHLIDIVMKIRAGYYSFEAANPRHEHEWRLWEDVKLPAGKAIIPGVITHASVLVEHPELVSERIQRFARAVGRENVIAGADCGFASTPRAVPEVHPTIVWAKFASLSEGARLATHALWT